MILIYKWISRDSTLIWGRIRIVDRLLKCRPALEPNTFHHCKFRLWSKMWPTPLLQHLDRRRQFFWRKTKTKQMTLFVGIFLLFSISKFIQELSIREKIRGLIQLTRRKSWSSLKLGILRAIPMSFDRFCELCSCLYRHHTEFSAKSLKIKRLFCKMIKKSVSFHWYSNLLRKIFMKYLYL